MTDLSRFFADLCAGLVGDTAGPFPGLDPKFPGENTPTGNSQTFDTNEISRISRISRSENTQTISDDTATTRFADFSDQRVGRTSSYEKTPGTPGRPGNGGKTFAGTTGSYFPVKEREPGNPGNGIGLCERSFPDPNRAGPQRADWWTGNLMTALAPQLAPAAPAGEQLLIPAAEVRDCVERELRALAVLGRTGAVALQDAIEITRAKVRNAPALAELQLNSWRCHICFEALQDRFPVVSVLTGKPGTKLFLHASCHDEHIQRRADLVEKIMAAAGFGAVEGRPWVDD